MSEPPSISHFALPLPLWLQPVSYRTAKYDPPKRAKRAAAREEEEDDNDDNDDNNEEGYLETDNEEEDVDRSFDVVAARRSRESTVKSERSRRSVSSSAAAAAAVLTPAEAHQYRVAGHAPDSDLPGGNFPHSRRGSMSSAATPFVAPRRRRDVERDLALLNPPVFVRGRSTMTTTRSTLRLRHLGVLTTILHRCLLQGDYVRAGRAWGLLLRDEWGGHALDVRTEGRWGVGAEILLRSRNGGDGGEEDDDGGWFSRAGFDKARYYYDRLVLHFPYRKHAPHALGPLHFYPAMFGLWISIVQEESRAAREAPLDEPEPEFIYDPNENMSICSGTAPDDRRRRAHAVARARTAELDEAQRIAARLDDLLVSPPFSDSYELLRLRAMISLWIGDLFVSSVSPDDPAAADNEGDNFASSAPYDHDGDVSMAYDEPVDSTLARMEEGLGNERKAAEVEKARAFFHRARRRKAGPLSDMDRLYIHKLQE
ncbi:hypothetical protein LOZ58_003016 [Ophidiomyces ophidiicola]|nr:hypothetical protein LOZ58_003016 [Ophidiomyces ophidiicola]